MFGPPKLPSDCRRVVRDIQARAQKWSSSHPEEEITLDCAFHYFVLDQYVTNHSDKPDPAAYGYDGLSVRVVGGTFGQLSKEELCRELIAFRKQTGRPYIGSVIWTAKDIMAKNYDLGFAIEHDPYPEERNGVVQEQGRRHAQIICEKKRTKRREILNDIVDWSLRPEEFEKLSETIARKDSVLRILVIAVIALMLKLLFDRQR